MARASSRLTSVHVNTSQNNSGCEVLQRVYRPSGRSHMLKMRTCVHRITGKRASAILFDNARYSNRRSVQFRDQQHQCDYGIPCWLNGAIIRPSTIRKTVYQYASDHHVKNATAQPTNPRMRTEDERHDGPRDKPSNTVCHKKRLASREHEEKTVTERQAKETHDVSPPTPALFTTRSRRLARA